VSRVGAGRPRWSRISVYQAVTIFEDGVDQYLGGAGLDIDSFAFAANLANFTDPGADGTNCAYGRIFESDSPQVGDWYYVGRCEILHDTVIKSNSVPIGRAEGGAWQFCGAFPLRAEQGSAGTAMRGY
jgi:hypothetical protein